MIVRCWTSWACIRLQSNTELFSVLGNSNQKLNPPQSLIVRGEGDTPADKGESCQTSYSHLVGDHDETFQPAPNVASEADVVVESSPSKTVADAPPLTRGGREGLGFLPYDKKLTALARENRKNPTPAENKMWREVLSRRQFTEYKFSRQKPIEYFIVYFYCAELRWVIEFDGDSHAEQQNYYERRTALLQQHGLQVIRYQNRDLLNNIAGVYDDLVRQLG